MRQLAAAFGEFDLPSGSLLPPTINARLGRDSHRGPQQAGADQSGSKLPRSKGRESILRFVTRKGTKRKIVSIVKTILIVVYKMYERIMVKRVKNVQTPEPRAKGRG